MKKKIHQILKKPWILWFFFQDRLRHSKCMCKYFKPFEHVISYQSITWNKVLALAKVRNADFVVNISLLQSTLLLHTSKVYYILNEWHLAVFYFIIIIHRLPLLFFFDVCEIISWNLSKIYEIKNERKELAQWLKSTYSSPHEKLLIKIEGHHHFQVLNGLLI